MKLDLANISDTLERNQTIVKVASFLDTVKYGGFIGGIVALCSVPHFGIGLAALAGAGTALGAYVGSAIAGYSSLLVGGITGSALSLLRKGRSLEKTVTWGQPV